MLSTGLVSSNLLEYTFFNSRIVFEFSIVISISLSETLKHLIFILISTFSNGFRYLGAILPSAKDTGSFMTNMGISYRYPWRSKFTVRLSFSIDISVASRSIRAVLGSASVAYLSTTHMCRRPSALDPQNSSLFC